MENDIKEACLVGRWAERYGRESAGAGGVCWPQEGRTYSVKSSILPLPCHRNSLSVNFLKNLKHPSSCSASAFISEL